MSRSTGSNVDDVLVLGGSKYPAIIDCEISSCVTKYNEEKGSDMVYITLQPLKEGEKAIKLDGFCRESKSESNFIKENHKRLANLFYLLNPDKESGAEWNVENRLTAEFSWETKKEEMVMRENYVDFLDKPVKALVTLYRKYRTIKVNGYSGKPIVSKRENEADWKIAIESPETIEMPDYSLTDKGQKKINYQYNVEGWFDYNTGKTLNELNHDLDAEEIEKKLASALKRKSYNEEEKTPAQLMEYRKEQLKNALKKSNVEFNEVLWNELNPVIGENPVNVYEIEAY